MRKEPKAAPKAAPVGSQPAMAVEFYQLVDSLARLERETARIQKKLGMDFSWYKAK
jgi:hypothetical protein